MDFSNQLFRCSSLGKIMTEGKGVTRETYLRQLHREIRYNRRKEFTSKYTDKGLMVEEDAITLYSRVHKNYYKKNEERLSNEFITGHPDLFIGPSINKAEKIIDIKASWDVFTFPYSTDKINKDYLYQLQGYMWLTGAKSATLAYCLINTPETLVLDEKRKLFYRMNAGTEENTDYIKACEELDRSMNFDDIPMKEKVIEFQIERDEWLISTIVARVKECRVSLTKLESSFTPSILLASHNPELSTTLIEKA